MNTEEFLSQIHYGEEKIHFRVINSKSHQLKNLYGSYDTLKPLLEDYNKKNFCIYFVVNSGGTKQQEISRINAVFADFDAGKDDEGRYFSLEQTEQFKQSSLEKIASFKFSPSIVVETRNGIHVYWLVNDSATTEQFLNCQLKLIQYFDSDKAITTPERIMRLPEYLWQKSTYDPYMCEVIQGNQMRYNIEEILEALPEVPECKEIKKEIQMNRDLKTNHEGKAFSNTTNNIEMIRTRDVKGLRDILFSIEQTYGLHPLLAPSIDTNDTLDYIDGAKTPQFTARNRDELFNYIHSINLFEFLGIQNNYFCCIIHDDHNPSASIFTVPETGHYLYKCRSSNCGFGVGSIIKVVESLQNCTKPQAISFIKEVYGISLMESDWQKEQKELLQTNIDYLLSDLFRIEYPALHSRIKRYISLLVMLHEYAKRYVYDQPLDGSLDTSIFFASERHLAKTFQVDYKRLSLRVNLFVFLGIIKKLNDTEIPSEMLNKSIALSKMNNRKYHTTYLSIPSYDFQCLSKAESYAQLFKTKHMVIEGFSREVILRTLGDQEANRVYPQKEGEKLPASSEFYLAEVERHMLDQIENFGYATEHNILRLMKGKYRINKTRLKRVLQEILDKYDLIRIRSNKELKMKFGITIAGYPFLIVLNS